LTSRQYGVVPLIVANDPEITLGGLRVYIALDSLAGTTGTWSGSLQSLCKRANSPMAVVARAVTLLVSKGFVLSEDEFYTMVLRPPEVFKTSKQVFVTNTCLTPEQESKVHADFDNVVGSALVSEQIELALSHDAARKYARKDLYVRNWMRNVQERHPHNGTGRNTNNRTDAGGYRGVGQVRGQARDDPEVQAWFKATYPDG